MLVEMLLFPIKHNIFLRFHTGTVLRIHKSQYFIFTFLYRQVTAIEFLQPKYPVPPPPPLEITVHDQFAFSHQEIALIDIIQSRKGKIVPRNPKLNLSFETGELLISSS